MKKTLTAIRNIDTAPLARLFEAGEPNLHFGGVRSPFTETPRLETKMSALALRQTLAPIRPDTTTIPVLPALPRLGTIQLEQIKGTLTNFRRDLTAQKVGTVTLTLPFGIDQCHVNAATFKALAGRDHDLLLRQTGERWEIVDDHEMVDLGDRTQVFKLGKVQIYS